MCVVFPDGTFVCDVLTGTDDGLLSLPLDKTSIPPTFGSPKKLIGGNPAGKMTLKIRCFNVRYHVVAMSETSWI